MLFNSYIFIFLFLPICLLGYFLINKTGHFKIGHLFLLAMSLWFYGYFNPRYLLVIIASVLINYLLYLWIKAWPGRKIPMITGVVINLGLLFYFKYMDFFIDNVNRIFKTDLAFFNIALPLGISFFTFQQISFIVDSYRGEVDSYDFLTYASYVTFFPQLIAGPIVTHDELIPQLQDESKKHFSWDNMAVGLFVFAMGLGKKVLLADVFASAVDYGFGNVPSLGIVNALLVIIGYSFQLYFDFSGYSDMAIGIGRMLNIDLPANFDSPYKSFTINEFWKRWHMTMTRFFTRYVYIPLGGSRKGALLTYFNLFIVFFLSGLWHGAAWTYVVWGVLNGIFCIFCRFFKGFFTRLPKAVGVVITYGYFMFTLVFFRAATCGQALDFLRQIWHRNYVAIPDTIFEAFETPYLTWLLSGGALQNVMPYICLCFYYALSFYIVFASKNSMEKMAAFSGKKSQLIFTVCIIALSIVSFSGVSAFLYFNF